MRYWLDTEFIEDGRTIDLLSIGIVAEDGREFYAESSDTDRSRASQWVRENVLPYLASVGDSGPQIAYQLRQFIGNDPHPEFWGYYADYDWVVFCQLFGTMMQLPKHWPKYCRDVKQLCDDRGNPQLPEVGKNEHHALADARWNRDAWEYLYRLKP